MGRVVPGPYFQAGRFCVVLGPCFQVGPCPGHMPSTKASTTQTCRAPTRPDPIDTRMEEELQNAPKLTVEHPIF